MIDLRSDTVTQPTRAMREAMAAAEVGDDVLGDDPTVAELERRTAALLGKEAAVYMPSGTMTNQVAIRAHSEPGDEIILADNAHVVLNEGGGPGGISGVLCHLLASDRGRFTGAALRGALRPRSHHFPPTKLVCIENTSNFGGGAVWPLAQVAEVAGVAHEAGLRVHMDGARLWNAAAASGTPEREYAAHADSVSVCFSKGLGAPVGSALAGSATFIERARRFRRMFGGGMRQAGIIAAGALHALTHHRERLLEDHENARALALGIASLPGITLDPAMVETNILFIRSDALPAAEFARRLEAAGVRVLAMGAVNVRAVANLMVRAADIPRAIEAFRVVLERV